MSRANAIKLILSNAGIRNVKYGPDGEVTGWTRNEKWEEMDILKAHTLALLDYTETIQKLLEENG